MEASTARAPELADALQEAKRQGQAHLTEIACEESENMGLPFDLCYDYLTNVMNYDLGERETLGFNTFRQKAMEHGLCKSH